MPTADINSCGPGDNTVGVARDMPRTRRRHGLVIDDGQIDDRQGVGRVMSSPVPWALMKDSRRKRVKHPG